MSTPQTATRFVSRSSARDSHAIPAGSISFADALVKVSGAGRESSATFVEKTKEFTARIKDVPLPAQRPRNRYFKEKFAREGVVTRVAPDGFVASLCESYGQFPAEEAFIPFDEIDPADMPFLQEGAKFFWRVGYLVSYGQQFSISHIEFRRSPAYTQRQLDAARRKAREYANLFP